MRGFKQSQADHVFFTRTVGSTSIVVLMYINDIIVASNDDAEVVQLKKFLSSNFKLKDLGHLKYFLGLEVSRSKARLSICQRHYALELLKDSGTLGSKPKSTPMDPNLKLFKDDEELLSYYNQT